MFLFFLWTKIHSLTKHCALDTGTDTRKTKHHHFWFSCIFRMGFPMSLPYLYGMYNIYIYYICNTHIHMIIYIFIMYIYCIHTYVNVSYVSYMYHITQMNRSIAVYLRIHSLVVKTSSSCGSSLSRYGITWTLKPGNKKRRPCVQPARGVKKKKGNCWGPESLLVSLGKSNHMNSHDMVKYDEIELIRDAVNSQGGAGFCWS